jgi:hypothetical protein
MKDKEFTYCPLFTIAYTVLQVQSPQVCMRGSCAWWHIHYSPDGLIKSEGCAILSIANNTKDRTL